MRISIASGFGYAWIPTPPDKSENVWKATCIKFNKY